MWDLNRVLMSDIDDSPLDEPVDKRDLVEGCERVVRRGQETDGCMGGWAVDLASSRGAIGFNYGRLELRDLDAGICAVSLGGYVGTDIVPREPDSDEEEAGENTTIHVYGGAFATISGLAAAFRSMK